MKEFIEKLIGRLEEENFNDIQIIVSGILEKYGFPKESIVQDEIWDALDELSTNKVVIPIVNQLAEEYKDKYVRRETLNQYMWERDTAISQLKDLGYGFGEKVGWIPCSEKMPLFIDNVLVCTKSGGRTIACLTTGKRFCDMYMNVIDDVVAWMPLPEPYQLKGE